MPEINEKKFSETVILMKDTAKHFELSKHIIEKATELSRKLLENIFPRHPYSLVALTSLLYTARRDLSCPAVTFRDFAETTPYAKDEIRRLFNKIAAIEDKRPPVCIIRPVIYVEEYGERLGFSKKALDCALALAKEISQKRVFQGKRTLVLASACLFVASHSAGEGSTQGEIANLCGISTASIRRVTRHEFFEKKNIKYKVFKPADEELLLSLILKAFPQTNQTEITFSQLRPNLRYMYSDKLRGFSIPITRLGSITKELEDENLVILVPGPKCPRPWPHFSGGRGISKCKLCYEEVCQGSLIRLPDRVDSTTSK